MRHFMKSLLVIILTPIFIIISLIMGIFYIIEPLAQSIGDGLNNIFSSMYDFWKDIFKWNT